MVSENFPVNVEQARSNNIFARCEKINLVLGIR